MWVYVVRHLYIQNASDQFSNYTNSDHTPNMRLLSKIPLFNLKKTVPSNVALQLNKSHKQENGSLAVLIYQMT